MMNTFACPCSFHYGCFLEVICSTSLFSSVSVAIVIKLTQQLESNKAWPKYKINYWIGLATVLEMQFFYG